MMTLLKRSHVVMALLIVILTMNGCFLFQDKQGRRTDRGARFPHDQEPGSKKQR
ncbi:hypothetical protein [Mucilaginibacter sp. PAMB04168]|uniref:hypothetical protein n=1 Tax=Mucilaginibacter sp. PAMB04168 TaxID=3138567 RepID=UPI0031F6F8D6